MVRGLVVALAMMAISAGTARAQKWSVGTNFLGWANLGTANVEMQFAASRHFTVDAEARYNPFIYNKDNLDKRLYNRRATCAVGVRYWPWVSYSGWNVRAAVQCEQFSRGGFSRMVSSEKSRASEGRAAGVVLGFGYTYMINTRLNLNVGADIWGGYEESKDYRYDEGTITFRSGSRMFLLPNTVHLGISWLFGKKPGFDSKKTRHHGQ